MLSAINQVSDASKQSAASLNPVNNPNPKKRKSLAQSLWIPTTLVIAGLLLLGFSLKSLFQDRNAENNDFFVAETSKPNPPVLAAPQPSPKPPAPAVSAPAPAPIQPAPPSPDVALPAPAPVSETIQPDPFATVKTSIVSKNLPYDPSVPEAKAIYMAGKHVKQNRLSAPTGNNAMESLGEAYKAAPKNPAIAAIANEVIKGMSKATQEAIKNKRDDSAMTLFNRSDKFVKQLNLQNNTAWAEFNNALPNLIVTRLQKDTAAINAQGIAASKKLATQLKLDQKLLEPAWTKASQLPKAGDAVKDNGPAMVLIQTPSGASKGLAVMREEVTRAEYERFARATNRAASVCKNAFAAAFVGKVDWQSPGFKQNADHPVVCVSHSDASAYAQWLSQRSGQKLRLPTSNEWRNLVNYRAGSGCQAGVIACGAKGTASGSSTPANPYGVYDLQGNVSEWLSDGGGAGRYPAAGLSWRDTPTSSANKATKQNANRGYDDVGFRLVRDVGTDDL
jgi:serine/threonine-protein kinase PpkA